MRSAVLVGTHHRCVRVGLGTGFRAIHGNSDVVHLVRVVTAISRNTLIDRVRAIFGPLLARALEHFAEFRARTEINVAVLGIDRLANGGILPIVATSVHAQLVANLFLGLGNPKPILELLHLFHQFIHGSLLPRIGH